jgi:exodeoxyribonuclease V alpha subunit
MLRRNLIYTAITRSKQFLIICGEEEALRIGVERADEQTRQTSLCDKLKNISENHEMNSDEEMDNDKLGENEKKSNLTYDEMMTSVDPMIGMDGITPYQFME